tara:strand:+ start:293 stop:691 length:399 start_codon:yes stop_codon:yes gene_type:complete
MTTKLPPKQPPYALDAETKSWLESALTVAAGVADLQHDDKAREDIYALLDELADRFLIEKHHIEFETDMEPIFGDTRTSIPLYGSPEDTHPVTTSPKLSLVRNDNEDPSSNIVDINSFNNKSSKDSDDPTIQ